ncbi:histidine phosphatase family protein [Heyndrickxia sp. NPDC080065]|uniref:histidine phosphatase family protein n=1 Tax=Heyndrickxia sp. NPDC080065 TaxID=3390568 RepID=UPI003CFF54BA
MQTNLFLVRHAHSDYTPDEVGRPLSQSGWEDAKIVTDLLKNQRIDHIISSPYKRAIQTVEGIAKYIDKEVEINTGFKERVLSENPVEDFRHAIRKVWEEPSFYWKGGESNLIAQKRGIEAIKQVLVRYKGKNIVIGTHGNIMTLMINHFDNRYDYHFWKELDMPDIYQLIFDDMKLLEIHRVWERNKDLMVNVRI